jgi:hypothetical protein
MWGDSLGRLYEWPLISAVTCGDLQFVSVSSPNRGRCSRRTTRSSLNLEKNHALPDVIVLTRMRRSAPTFGRQGLRRSSRSCLRCNIQSYSYHFPSKSSGQNPFVGSPVRRKCLWLFVHSTRYLVHASGRKGRKVAALCLPARHECSWPNAVSAHT